MPDLSDLIPQRLIAGLLRILWEVLYQAIIEVVGWAVGWCVLRAVTFGQYPKQGITEAEAVEDSHTTFFVVLVGLVSIALAVWGLLSL